MTQTRRWYFVRHAETVWNSENRLQGGADTPLTPLGASQAARLCAYFSARPIRTIVSSGLRRTQETAQAIAQGNGHRLNPRVESGLAEIRLGAWEGLTPEEINTRYDGAYARWRLTPSAMEIPGAEPFDAFLRRVRQARDQLLTTLEGEEAVIVTHGGVIAALLADVLQADYDRLLQHLRLDNAGITAVEFFEAGHYASVLWINTTTHLEGLETKPSLPSG